MNWLGAFALVVVVVVAGVHAQACGKPTRTPATGNYEAGDRIVGGRIANPHSWPWQVSLVISVGHNCGGTLISDKWVLTAAHCLVGRYPSGMASKVGEHSLRSFDFGEQLIGSQKFVIHPNYSPFGSGNDIALIKLSRSVVLSETVQPACLPKQGDEVPVGTMTYVTGWGSTGVTPSSDKLKQTMVPVVNWSQCRNMHSMPVAANTICTGFASGGHNPCFGDSGGPLVVNSGKGWVLHGVVSWGPKTCAIKEEPAVFTKVSAFVPWINRVMANN